MHNQIVAEAQIGWIEADVVTTREAETQHELLLSHLRTVSGVQTPEGILGDTVRNSSNENNQRFTPRMLDDNTNWGQRIGISDPKCGSSRPIRPEDLLLESVRAMATPTTGLSNSQARLLNTLWSNGNSTTVHSSLSAKEQKDIDEWTDIKPLPEITKGTRIPMAVLISKDDDGDTPDEDLISHDVAYAHVQALSQSDEYLQIPPGEKNYASSSQHPATGRKEKSE